ncbi:hypothetical protein PIIN_10048 [Serendipita indica DSM 11827]|uniref:Uncharacterized protein n=1 Tax=Serendipita indica (strain DSM 11827) TaxID=1109443 RepID=G4TXK5_SERID|nr:hypothetical protein PIIN_10048 [Serendipita indica DSM 11827]
MSSSQIFTSAQGETPTSASTADTSQPVGNRCVQCDRAIGMVRSRSQSEVTSEEVYVHRRFERLHIE